MSFTIATWNINSVRLRLPLVKRFVEANRPDVICLQETKVRDSEFPFDRLRELGYDHIEISGQKGYHGVATLSRHPLTRVVRGPFCREGHSRHLAVTLADGAGSAAGLTIHNFYVPAGGDEPDPEVNPKFSHKLDFVGRMSRGPDEGHLAPERAIIVGDLNIAPLETDVWSHKALLKVVSHTPIEVEAFGRLQAAGRMGRRHAGADPAARETLHVVELPLTRLGSRRQGPTARSCLVEPGSPPVSRRRDGRPRGP